MAPTSRIARVGAEFFKLLPFLTAPVFGPTRACARFKELLLRHFSSFLFVRGFGHPNREG
jgi:hypothetical protein